MAYTKIIAIHDRLDLAINYVLNEEKTTYEHQQFKGAVNCSIDKAYRQMADTKEQYGSKGSIKGYHIIQSFAPSEIEPKIAFEIAQQFIKEYLCDYEVVFSTHVDKGHIHNHITFSAVSFIDGRKYRSNKSTYYNGVRKVSDNLCRQYGLSIIEPNRENTKLSYVEWLGEKTDKVTWNKIIRDDIDHVIKECYSFGEFILDMEFNGYQVKVGKYISFRPYGKERFVRGKTLGSKYTREYIKAKVEGNVLPVILDIPERKPTPKPQKTPRLFMTDIERNYWHTMYKLNLVKKHQAPRPVSKHYKQDLLLFERRKEEFRFLRKQNIKYESEFIEFKKALELELVQFQEKMQPISQEINKHRTEFKAIKDIIQYEKAYKLFIEGYDVMQPEHDIYENAVKKLESKGYCIEDLDKIKELQIDLYNKRSDVNQDIQGVRDDLRICKNIEQTTAQMREREERIRIMLEKSKNKDKNRVR